MVRITNLSVFTLLSTAIFFTPAHAKICSRDNVKWVATVDGRINNGMAILYKGFKWGLSNNQIIATVGKCAGASSAQIHIQANYGRRGGLWGNHCGQTTTPCD